VPNHVALNNISKTEKDKVVKFLEDGMKNITIEKTIGELNNLISFIKSDQNIDNPIETIVGFTKNLDELYQTNANSLNGIDFDSMIVENFPK